MWFSLMIWKFLSVSLVDWITDLDGDTLLDIQLKHELENWKASGDNFLKEIWKFKI